MAPVDHVAARAYRVPTPEPETDGTLGWDATTVVVVHVRAADVTGLGWTYADAACVPLVEGVLAGAVTGRPVLDVPACWAAMRHAVRNLGRPGLVSCAISAVDIALWDAAARSVGLPLCRLLGRVRESVPVYASGGFTSMDDAALRAWLEHWAGRVPRVKIKIGADLDRVALTRATVGDAAEVYVDANGAYSVGQARRVARRLADWDVTWFEEPVSSDDLAGLAEVRAVSPPDVAAGEYGYDLPYFARMAGVVDCLQIDVTRCGGYTEFARAAAVAAAVNRDVSAHCANSLSAQIGAATQNLRHLEWFADHDRVEDLLFDGGLRPVDGVVTPSASVSGHGLSLKEDAARRYAVAL
ncbi:enolase C-terminal domain-like protein [Herbidospora sp. NBRC 101105]|uniref:enolase C-terminal domain-like protein n=1 Tax=Herbidospora sp. NBRC 101105 TaxID=3032195 RepID=UPI0024A28EF0|nr:enolase C-terminal domain-like protein [Herbidospora sp. NBRC 101105]GLX93166.1 mandelate racemase [Herbidospora sp. NBRC 101105]